MTGARKMRFLRTQTARIVSVDGVELRQHPEEPTDVLRGAAMDEIEIDRADGRSLEDPRRHADDDELDFVRGQELEDVSEPGSSHSFPESRKRLR